MDAGEGLGSDRWRGAPPAGAPRHCRGREEEVWWPSGGRFGGFLPAGVLRPPSPSRRAVSGPSPSMSELDRIAQLLDRSGDRDNPDPARIRALLSGVKTLAVVGISRDPLKPARRVPSYLAAKGLDVIPVNPFAEWLLGRPALASLAEVEEPVDLVLVFRPSGEAGAYIRTAALRSERPAVWLQEGIRDDVAAREAREAGVVVVQDLCLYRVHRALPMNLPRPFRMRERPPEAQGPSPGSERSRVPPPVAEG